MQVHQGLGQLPDFRNPVLTIGSFDGVHKGHRAIIKRLVSKAQEVKGDSIILTFEPHPRQVVFPNDDSLRLLSTLEEKIQLLESTGVEHLIILPFTIEFSQINPYRYVDEVLIEKIGVKHLIIGYDHKFGLNRDGDIDLLKIYSKQEKFSIEEIPRQDIDDLRVSSTKIRNHLLNGNIQIANLMLGAPYSISGVVTKGSQVAGSLGFPTANCKVQHKNKLIPGAGTYAARAICAGKNYEGMLYIGTSPTLQSRSETFIEMNLFGIVNEPLYNFEISIYPEKKFRDDQKFKSKSELLFNINQDRIEVEHYFLSKEIEKPVTSAILNYNGKEYLEKYLIYHHNTAYNQRLVIDNNSSDGSKQWLSMHSVDTDIIGLNKNYGFAGGYNKGIERIGSKYIAIVNSDVRVTDNWLQPIIELLEKDDKIAAVQPKILSLEKPNQFEYAGAAGGYIDALGYPLCRGRLLNSVENDEGQYNEQTEIFWASGAAMVIRSDLFKKAGGFDEDFFAHMEEIDLCWRLKKAGYKISYQPDSVVYHLGGGTLSYNSRRKVFLNLRNNYWMLLKNKSGTELIFIMPIRIFVDVAYSFSLILKGQFGKSIAALHGIIMGISGLFSIAKKRQAIQYFVRRYAVGTKNDLGIQSVILPFAYYILNKKKFSDLK